MEHINLIRKIAWSFHHSTGLDWDDLFSEASWLYCKALKSYDPAKGKLSTYVWWFISSELKDYIALQKRQHGHICLWEDIKVNPIVSENDFLDTLSKDALEIANLVLITSKKFVVLSSEQAEQRIKNIMENRGWDESKINQGILDLKAACK